MIVLKILLWILLAIIGIFLLICIIPASAEAGYIDKKFTYKISYGFVNLYDSGGKGLARKFLNRRKNKKPEKDSEKDSDDTDDFEMPEPDEIYENTEEELPEPDIYSEDEIIEEVEETFEDEEIVEEIIEEKKEKIKDKPKKEKKSGKKSEKEKNSDDSEEEETEKESNLDKKIELVLDLVRAADRPLINICKGIKFSKLYIDFMIADEDAYKCALNYGQISGMVYNLIGYMATLFTVSYKTVDIFPNFKEKESRWDISVKCSFKLITLIVAGLYFLITYMFKFFIPQKMQERKLRKQRKKRKLKK